MIVFEKTHYDCSVMFRRQDREHVKMIVLWVSNVTKILRADGYGEDQRGGVPEVRR
jgi:hypothetical protein